MSFLRLLMVRTFGNRPLHFFYTRTCMLDTKSLKSLPNTATLRLLVRTFANQPLHFLRSDAEKPALNMCS
jgi:hypothetical protein